MLNMFPHFPSAWYSTVGGGGGGGESFRHPCSVQYLNFFAVYWCIFDDEIDYCTISVFVL